MGSNETYIPTANQGSFALYRLLKLLTYVNQLFEGPVFVFTLLFERFESF